MPLTTDPHDLIGRARALAPMVAANDAEAKELRRLPDRSAKDLFASGLIQALQPARYGGLEAHPADWLDAITEMSAVSGSHGWVCGILGAHPWQIGLFSPELQDEMWANDPQSVNASSFNPTGTAERVKGGFRLSGRWSFLSGVDFADWVLLGGVPGMTEVDGAPAPEFTAFVVPKSDYQIDQDSWVVAGLQGTGSKDIVIDDAFVPDHRTQSLWDYYLGNPLAGWEVNENPLYRIPFFAFFGYMLSSAVVGIAQGFLDEWMSHNTGRVTYYGGVQVEEDPGFHELAARAAYEIDGARLKMRRDFDEMLDFAAQGVSPPKDRRAFYRVDSTTGAFRCYEAVEELFSASSGRAISLDHPLQQKFQDIRAAFAHAYLTPQVNQRYYGAVKFGHPYPGMY